MIALHALAAASSSPAYLLQHERSARAINCNSAWACDFHRNDGACIVPPKVGLQCTMKIADALRGCIGQTQPPCHSITCPPADDQGYGIGRAAGIRSQICLSRRVSTPIDPMLSKHPMCRGRCDSYFLHEVALHHHAVAGADQPRAVVLVPDSIRDMARDLLAKAVPMASVPTFTLLRMSSSRGVHNTSDAPSHQYAQRVRDGKEGVLRAFSIG